MMEDSTQKRRIYISLPMTGHEASVMQRYQKAVEELLQWRDPEKQGNVTLVASHNILYFVNGGYYGEPIDWYDAIAEDLALLQTCDEIYLTRGWEESKGCRLEGAVASQRGMRCLYAKDAAEKIDDNEATATFEVIKGDENVGRTFVMTKKSVDEAQAFMKEHSKCVNPECLKGTSPASPFSYIIKPTTIGDMMHIRCDHCGAELDITDVSNW